MFERRGKEGEGLGERKEEGERIGILGKKERIKNLNVIINLSFSY